MMFINTVLTTQAAAPTTGRWDAAATLDALPERVIRFRLPDLFIIYCNTAWAEQYHLEPAQVIGHTLDQFLLEDGLAGLNSQLALLSLENPVLTDLLARNAPNAPGRWVEWVDRYLVDDEGAQVLAVGRYVTRRHIAELQLAESEARFRVSPTSRPTSCGASPPHRSRTSATWALRSRRSLAIRRRTSSRTSAGCSMSSTRRADLPSLAPSVVAKCSSASTAASVMPTARSSSARHRQRKCAVDCRA